MAGDISNDCDFLERLINQMPSEPPMALISEYASKNRILPPNSPFPGLWDNAKTPYLVEIMDNMSPFSPIQHVTFMKGCQIGATAAIENCIVYHMGEYPATILYISATEQMLDTWGSSRLTPLIESCGIKLVTSENTNKKSRRTGDKMLKKEYVGGTLRMTSAQSPSGQRSDAVMILFRDEIDGAPRLLRTGEGDWLSVSAGRIRSYGSRGKIMDVSTPTTIENSVINEQYELGDKRKYLVPCPLCGVYQELVFGGEDSKHGLKGEYQGGNFLRAYYLCEHCHDAFFNFHKTEMLAAGRWEPSKKANMPNSRSYHLGAVYSPVGMYAWDTLYLDYITAQSQPEGMRSFVNLTLGYPYKETGSRPKLENVLALRGAYKKGVVQPGALYLTAGIDVQTGSKKDKNNPARLEMEVMATGMDYRTWSVDYRQFIGPVDDPHSGAWADLSEFAENGGFTYKREDGKEFSTKMIFIDSGDGNVTDIVYQFVEFWDNTFASKGFADLKRRAREKVDRGDEVGPENSKRYRLTKLDAGKSIVQISTNFYKGQIYRALKVPRQEIGDQRGSFCDFPKEYDEHYFRMLTAEEMRVDRSFHCPSGRRNEALDCRVMCVCASHLYLNQRLERLKIWAKGQGMSLVEMEKIGYTQALKTIQREVQ